MLRHSILFEGLYTSLRTSSDSAPILHKKVKHRDMPSIPEVKPSMDSLEGLACRVYVLPLRLGTHTSQTLQHTAAWEVFSKLKCQPVPEETDFCGGMRSRRHYFCCVFFLFITFVIIVIIRCVCADVQPCTHRGISVKVRQQLMEICSPPSTMRVLALNPENQTW